MTEVDFGFIEAGAHVGVSGSRHEPTREAWNALRFCLEQLQAMGARYLHQGCCTGWDELSVPLAHKSGMYVVGHPPVKTDYLSETAVKESDEVWPAKSYHDRDEDIAWETAIMIIGPRYPEDHLASARSGTWLTTRLARSYGSRCYACTPYGEITDVTEKHDST
jgi:hypothetical protein